MKSLDGLTWNYPNVFLFNNTLPASIQVHIKCLCIKAVTDTVQHGPAKINFNMCKDGSFI